MIGSLPAYSNPWVVMGYWNDPDNQPIHVRPPADGCVWAAVCFGYIRRDDVFNNARDNGLFWADQIRSENILVYTIGLGDTSQPPGSILQPDQNYLRQLANEDGITDPDQPKGKMYFAPSAAELRTVFNLVAQDLLARLARLKIPSAGWLTSSKKIGLAFSVFRPSGSRITGSGSGRKGACSSAG